MNRYGGGERGKDCELGRPVSAVLGHSTYLEAVAHAVDAPDDLEQTARRR
jgi:hypothetical protein